MLEEAIRHYRNMNNMTQQELAKIISCSVDSVRRWEANTREPRTSEFQKLCEAFHCTESELLNGPVKQEFEVKILMGVKTLPNVAGIEITDNSLLSERMIVKRVKGRNTITWEPRAKHIRNEPLDTRVYATGALEILNPNFEQHARRRGKSTEKTSMPKLKPPVLIKATEENQEEIKEVKPPEIKKPVIRTNPPSVFIRRGLRL